MDQQQLIIWFAGFYEGEGSISNDISNRNRIVVSISQNDITPLEKGKEIWGGSIRKRERKSPCSEKICIGHEWKLNHIQGLKFIDDIKPYMIIPYKINQIKKCVDKQNEKWTTKFKCSFCEDIFTDMSGRRRHEKTQHIEKGIKHQCIYCDKEYNTIDTMKRHIKLNHNLVASHN
jgi:hypothetical protein